MLDEEQKAAVEFLIKNVGDGCIYPHFRNFNSTRVEFKESHLDPVTIADRKAESLLKDGLSKILPESKFVGEELYATSPEILDYLRQDNNPVWIVDPLDGTSNFISGKMGFGPMICLFYAGEILASWFYEICSKKLTVFDKAEGVKINDKPYKFSTRGNGSRSGYIGHKLYRILGAGEIIHSISNFTIDSTEQPSIIAYNRLLMGELDFLIYKVTFPWDHLPGIALVSTIGAVSKRWDGKRFQYTDINDGLVVVRDSRILDQVMTQIVEPLRLLEKI